MPDINPSNTDAVLGGQNPPPVDAAVLGGEIGRKQRLKYKKTQKFWQNFEYFNDYPHCHAITFAGRQVIDLEPGVKIEDPMHSAYAVRSDEIEEFKSKWNFLLQSDRANEIEVLLFSFVDFDDSDIKDLPSLEYLELWLGSKWYGGTSCIADLMTIISGDKFPKLKYLGLRNCEYTDDIAFELAQSPFIKHLYDLDLSMGTLGDEGLKALLTCPDINELCTLNVSKNYISKNFIEEILPQLKLTCEVIIDNQQCDEYVVRSNRYCVVAE